MSTTLHKKHNNNVIKINPYNPNNFLATKEQVESILRKVGVNVPICDIGKYHQAFTHKSYIRSILTNKTVEIDLVRDKNTVELQDESNERLEFLGDQITNSIIVYYLFQRFPTEQEGFLTKLKTNLISTRFYARFARYLDLGRFMIVSRFVEEQANGRNSEKLLENLFESFMGALFLDFSNVPSVYTTRLNLLSGPGYEICEKLVHHLLNTLIDFDDLTQNDRNFKDILLRYYQANFGIVPRYCEISSEGPPNNRIFTMGVYDADGNIVGRGSGNSKKKGEQEASLDALKHYGAM